MTAPFPIEAELAIKDLYEALAYFYDLNFGEVCLPEDRPFYLMKAREAAAECFAKYHHHVYPHRTETHVERVRREKREADEREQIRLPVKQHLAAERATVRARLAAGVRVMDGWADVPEPKRKQQAGAFIALARQLVDLSDQVVAPLPTTSICVCPYCKRIVLPSILTGFGCERCRAWWMPRARDNHAPLPPGFWDTKLPGDAYGRALPEPLEAPRPKPTRKRAAPADTTEDVA